MSNELSRVLKQKPDAMLRLQGQTQKPIVLEDSGGNYYAPEPADYSQSLAEGKNILIVVSGNTKTIHAVMGLFEGDNISISEPDDDGKVIVSGTLSGKGISIADFAGKNGYALTYNETSDIFELAAVSGGGGDALNVFSGGGTTVEDFESVDITFPYIVSLAPSGTAARTTADKQSGAYSFSIYQNEYQSKVSKVTFEVDLVVQGAIEFYFKYVPQVSSTKPTATIKVDGVTVFSSVNLTEWTKISGDYLAGIHTIECAITAPPTVIRTGRLYIDNISIPANGFTGNDAVEQNPDSLLISASDGRSIGFIPKTYYMESLSGIVLPTASLVYRGKIFTVLGAAGIADLSYVCQKNAANAYVWNAI